VYKKAYSTTLCKLNEIRTKPSIIPKRIPKNTSSKRPKLTLITASGKTKYIAMPDNDAKLPNNKYGNL